MSQFARNLHPMVSSDQALRGDSSLNSEQLRSSPRLEIFSHEPCVTFYAQKGTLYSIGSCNQGCRIQLEQRAGVHGAQGRSDFRVSNPRPVVIGFFQRLLGEVFRYAFCLSVCHSNNCQNRASSGRLFERRHLHGLRQSIFCLLTPQHKRAHDGAYRSHCLHPRSNGAAVDPTTPCYVACRCQCCNADKHVARYSPNALAHPMTLVFVRIVA